jgi:hypothetical protein
MYRQTGSEVERGHKPTGKAHEKCLTKLIDFID